MPDYAGFWARAAAFVLDAVIVTVILVPILVLGFGLREVSLDLAEQWWDVIALVAIGAAVIGFWRYCGATPGKLALALKVVDAKSGQPPSTGRLVVRFLAYFVSAPFYLGFLWIAIDRRKQGWHDKIAGTVVINSED